MKVCVVGQGYIGLPTGLMMASHGVEVEAVDSKQSVVERLQQGQVTFREQGIEEIFQAAVKAGISFRTDCPAADMYIVAVPTPYFEETKEVDDRYVVQAVGQILEVCPDGAIVVIESTIAPGTIDRDVRPLTEKSGKNIRLAHAPERIIPGNMVYELMNNPRTIGCDDRETGEQIAAVYKSFCKGEIVLTDIKTAEMSKIVENTFRDINIAYANELCKICRQDGMDVYEVIRIANKHPRVNILQPGPGVGGHCISVDPWFLVGGFPETAELIRKAREVNTAMPAYVLERIQSVMQKKGIRSMSRVGLYGLTYKEDVDDVRESPTLQLLEVIKEKGLPAPAVFDPMVSRKIAERQYGEFEDFWSGIDMVVVLVGHSHLGQEIHRIMEKVVLDTRNVVPGAIKL